MVLRWITLWTAWSLLAWLRSIYNLSEFCILWESKMAPEQEGRWDSWKVGGLLHLSGHCPQWGGWESLPTCMGTSLATAPRPGCQEQPGPGGPREDALPQDTAKFCLPSWAIWSLWIPFQPHRNWGLLGRTNSGRPPSRPHSLPCSSLWGLPLLARATRRADYPAQLQQDRHPVFPNTFPLEVLRDKRFRNLRPSNKVSLSSLLARCKLRKPHSGVPKLNIVLECPQCPDQELQMRWAYERIQNILFP